MTNTPTTPPEVVEQWRAEFEAVMLRKYPKMDFGVFSDGEYWTAYINENWQGFLLGRQTVAIELTIGKHLGTDRHHYFISVEILLEAITAQGYQCRVNGE